MPARANRVKKGEGRELNGSFRGKLLNLADSFGDEIVIIMVFVMIPAMYRIRNYIIIGDYSDDNVETGNANSYLLPGEKDSLKKFVPL